MNFNIITLFQNIFDSYINESILMRAQKNKIVRFKFYNPRDFVKPNKSQSNKKKPYLRIDNKPYGGGPGMVIEALPVIKALQKIFKIQKKIKHKDHKHLIVWLSPSGQQFNNTIAEKYKKYNSITIICGRYEGIDERVKKFIKNERKENKNLYFTELSIGPYILTGGELPGMIIIDSVARRISGVLGKEASVEENRISSPAVYTRPEFFNHGGEKYAVPKILLSGNHKKIEDWKKRNRPNNESQNTAI